MKNSGFYFRQKAGKTVIKSGGTIGRAAAWLMPLVIISIFCAGLSSVGHGTADPLTPEERAWLNRHDGKIIVNNEAGWPPIIDTDKEGNSFGIVMDYQQLIEKKLGFKFKFDKLDRWENFMERFRKGEIHVNNNLQKTQERAEYALFTKPYIEIPNAVIVRSEIKGSLSLEKMHGMKIAVTNGFAIHDYIKKNHGSLELIALDDDLKCLLETSTRNADAAVVNLAVASYLIEKHGISNLRVAGYADFTNSLCFASRKDWPILNQILEKGLALITQAEKDDIYKKWISLGYMPFYKNRNFWIIVTGITALFITIILTVVVMNRSLKRLVEQRTETLLKQTDDLRKEIEWRKQAEEALKESEERFRYLSDASMEAIFFSKKGFCLDANQVAAELFGYEDPAEFIGRFGTDIIAPESHDIVKSKMLNDIFEPYEAVGMRRNGTRFPISIRAKAMPYKNEGIVRVTSICDITEIKRVEKALQESETRLRTIFEVSQAGIILVDQQGAIIYANQGMAKMLGCTQQELIGSTYPEHVHPDQRDMGDQRMRQLIAGEIDSVAIERHYIRKDGTDFWGFLSGRRHEDNQGKIISLVGIIADITELKTLENELRQAKKMEAVGTLAGGIAHDFNNLLMGIQGRSSLMSLDMDSSHPHREHILAIEEYIRSATSLTQQLLGFARGGKYEVKAIDMNELLLGSSAMFGRTRKEIRVHTKCAKLPLVVEADRRQIEQVLLNMYVNAWQAMPPEGGELYLETKIVTLDEACCKTHRAKPGRFVKISITDTGAGMDEATRLRIFDPFFTTKVMGRGTGLGLSSAYGIIKNHGGMITVYSEIGHGTIFNIYLPASDQEAHQEISQEEELVKGLGTILLVDDEELIIDVGQAMLERLGYSVVTCKGGQEAVRAIMDMGDKIDMVILDLIMPGMDGEKTFDRIRDIRPQMPVILSSGYAINGKATEIMQRGCNGFIQKPYNLSELSQKIRKVLDESN